MGIWYSDAMNVSYDSDKLVFFIKVRLSHYGCGFCSMDYVALSFSNQQQLLEKC
jgi:hypothetical protein